MPDLTRYKMAIYAPAGRGPLTFDCWGLFRDAFHHIYSYPLLPSFGGMTAFSSRSAGADLSPFFAPVERLEETCAVIGYVGKRSVHIGLAISRTKVFHASAESGICVQSLRDFSRNAGARIEILKWQQ